MLRVRLVTAAQIIFHLGQVLFYLNRVSFFSIVQISSIFSKHVRSAFTAMSGLLIIPLIQDKDHFEEVYKSFQVIASDVERFLAAYLHAIFIRKMKTQEALSLITKYVVV